MKGSDQQAYKLLLSVDGRKKSKQTDVKKRMTKTLETNQVQKRM